MDSQQRMIITPEMIHQAAITEREGLIACFIAAKLPLSQIDVSDLFEQRLTIILLDKQISTLQDVVDTGRIKLLEFVGIDGKDIAEIIRILKRFRVKLPEQ